MFLRKHRRAAPPASRAHSGHPHPLSPLTPPLEHDRLLGCLQGLEQPGGCLPSSPAPPSPLPAGKLQPHLWGPCTHSSFPCLGDLELSWLKSQHASYPLYKQPFWNGTLPIHPPWQCPQRTGTASSVQAWPLGIPGFSPPSLGVGKSWMHTRDFWPCLLWPLVHLPESA